MGGSSEPSVKKLSKNPTSTFSGSSLVNLTSFIDTTVNLLDYNYIYIGNNITTTAVNGGYVITQGGRLTGSNYYLMPIVIGLNSDFKSNLSKTWALSKGVVWNGGSPVWSDTPIQVKIELNSSGCVSYLGIAPYGQLSGVVFWLLT